MSTLHWTQVVLAELGTLMATMRRNARWRDALLTATAHPSAAAASAAAQPAGPPTSTAIARSASAATPPPAAHVVDPSLPGVDQPSNMHALIASLLRLRDSLEHAHALRDMDAVSLVMPFLDIIRSAETTGPITGAALTAVEKFLLLNLIDRSSFNAAAAISAVVHAATHCKFEATDAVSDEIVLMKLLAVLDAAFASSVGVLLSDEAVCEMIETAFSMCFQMRLSELLRKSAEKTLTALIIGIFNIVQKENIPILAKSPTQSHININQDTGISTVQEVNLRNISQADTIEAHGIRSATSEDFVHVVNEERRDNAISSVPFGIPSVRELLRFLVGILNPNEQRNTDTMRIMGLTMLELIMEIGTGVIVRHVDEGLLPLIFNDGCRYMFQLIRHAEMNNSAILLSQVLKTIVTVLQALGDRMIVQQEFYLAYFIDKLNLSLPTIPFPSDLSSKNPESEKRRDSILKRIRNSALKNGIDWIIDGIDGSGNFVILEDYCVDDAATASHTTNIHPLSVNVLFSGFSTAGSRSPGISANARIGGQWNLELTELYLDVLYQLIRHPPFLSTVFVEYDCDTNSKDLFEDMILVLSRGIAVPSMLSEMRAMSVQNSSRTKIPEKNTYAYEVFYPWHERKATTRDSTIPENDTSYYEQTEEEMALNNALEIASRNARSLQARIVSNACLDMLMIILNQMTTRLSNFSSEIFDHDPPVKVLSLLKNKRQKRQLLRAAQIFNFQSPKACLAYLESIHLLPKDPRPQDIANFLHSTDLLNKKALGEYLAKPANLPILHAYVDKFEWGTRRLDEALRMMLEKFRLPGEAQQIERVVDALAGGYFERVTKVELEAYHAEKEKQTNPSLSKSNLDIDLNEAPPLTRDAIFVLAYSIIMLNTDQHNPQVRRRMTVDDFIRNNRGTNEGKNFPKAYLESIYNAIKENEIIMPEEHGDTDIGFDYHWKSIQKRARDRPNASVISISDPSIIPHYDRQMFLLVWKVVSAAILYGFNSFESESALQKAISAYYILCQLAAKYKLHGILDYVVIGVLRTTKLLRQSTLTVPYLPNLPIPYTGNLADVIWSDHQETLVKDGYAEYRRRQKFLSWFSKDFRSQVAALIVFKVANEFGNEMRDSWIYLLDCIRNLYHFSLLAEDIVSTLNIDGTSSALLPKASSIASSRDQRKAVRDNSSSIFSALSSFLLSTSGPSDIDYESSAYQQQLTPEQIETENACRSIVAECLIGDLMAKQSPKFDRTTTPLLLQHLLSIGQIAVVNGEMQILGSSSAIDHALFFLELATRLAVNKSSLCDVTWNVLKEPLIHIIKNPQHHHIYLVRQSIMSLFRFAEAILLECSVKKESTAILNIHNEILLVQSEVIELIRNLPILLETENFVVSTPEDSKKNIQRVGLLGYQANIPAVHYFGEVTMAGLRKLSLLLLSTEPCFHIQTQITDSDNNITLSTMTGGKFFFIKLWESVSRCISLTTNDLGIINNIDNVHSSQAFFTNGGSHWAWLLLRSVIDFPGYFSDNTDVIGTDVILNPATFLEIVELLTEFIVGVAITTSTFQPQGPDMIVSASTVAAKLASAVSPEQTSFAESDDSPKKAKPNSTTIRVQNMVKRGMDALSTLYGLHHKVPFLVEMQRRTNNRTIDLNEVWDTYWLPILSSLGQQCYHPSRDIRQQAISHFQRALLFSDLRCYYVVIDGTLVGKDASADESKPIYMNVFYTVLFPLLDTLLKPEVSRLDLSLVQTIMNSNSPTGARTPHDGGSSKVDIPSFTGSPPRQGSSVDDVRIRLSAIVSKIFLHYLHDIFTLFEAEEICKLWSRILTTLEAYWNCGMKSTYLPPSVVDASLSEAIPESLKNMLLVMATSGFFADSYNGLPIQIDTKDLEKGRQLWLSTWKNVHSWLPSLKSELFPELPPEPASSSEVIPKEPIAELQETVAQ